MQIKTLYFIFFQLINMTTERLPVARNPLELADDLASSVLKNGAHTTELLMTSVPPTEDLLLTHMFGMFHGVIPLRKRHILQWPTNVSHLQCLHCGGQCSAGPPVPAVRQYEIQNDQYWVYGPFCRPCCAFGWICETDTTSKQLAPTAELLRRYFGLKKIVVAPPRCAHQRFGGPLTDYQFYGESGYTVLTTLQPPFVTYANYVVAQHQQHSELVKAHSLLPQSAGRLVGLERPKERSYPLAEKKSSGKAPLLLEFLATLSSTNDVKDVTEEVIVRSPKKRARLDGPTQESKETTNFLKQYVKPKKVQDGPSAP
jgi:hypothetical protein